MNESSNVAKYYRDLHQEGICCFNSIPRGYIITSQTKWFIFFMRSQYPFTYYCVFTTVLQPRAYLTRDALFLEKGS